MAETAGVWTCPDCGREFPYLSMAEGRRYSRQHNCQSLRGREAQVSIFPIGFDVVAEHGDTRVIVTVARTGGVVDPKYRVRDNLDVEGQPVVDREFEASQEAVDFATKVAMAKLEALVELKDKEQELADRWRDKLGGTTVTQEM